MRHSRRVRALAVSLAFATGCAGVSIAPQTAVRPGPLASPASVVLAPLGLSPQAFELNGSPMLFRMQRDLGAEVAQAGLFSRVVPERDLPAGGLPGSYLLRYRILHHEVAVANDGTGCMMGLLMTGCILLVPLFFMGMCTSTNEHQLAVEAQLFDVSRAPLQTVTDMAADQLVTRYDTSEQVPILHKEYDLRVDVTGPAGVRRGYSGARGLDEEALEVVRQLVAVSAVDLAAALPRGERAAL